MITSEQFAWLKWLLLFKIFFPHRSLFQSRLRGNSRGPSREPSFEDERESSRSSVKSRSTTYISGGSVKSSSGNNTPSSTPNTVKIEIKDAKKSVPPSPAIKKKVSREGMLYHFCKKYFSARHHQRAPPHRPGGPSLLQSPETTWRLAKTAGGILQMTE